MVQLQPGFAMIYGGHWPGGITNLSLPGSVAGTGPSYFRNGSVTVEADLGLVTAAALSCVVSCQTGSLTVRPSTPEG